MSTAPSTLSVPLPSDDRAARMMLDRLAHALASSHDDAGVAIVQRIGERGGSLWVRPAALLGATAISSLGRVGSREPAARPLSTVPPGWVARFGALVAVPETPSRRPTDEPPRLSRSTGPSLRGPGFVDVHTFWVPRREGGLWCARAFRVVAPSEETADVGADAAGASLAQCWASRLGRSCRSRPLTEPKCQRVWSTLGTDALPREAWTPVAAERAAGLGDLPRPVASVASISRTPGHVAVFGTSGAGKTSFLAELAREAIHRGESVVAIDLHGDLGPAILDRLDSSDRARVTALDATHRPSPGINVLAVPPGADPEPVVAHLVAAFKRLSPDGEAIYWGFRMERIFDSFLRLVQEEGGSLVDLASALQNPSRREALRVRTRRVELARFLDELGPIVGRQPDFLWSAAARVAKIVLVPALQELLAPNDGGIDPHAILDEGRSLIVRIPFAVIGSEATALASTLLLARLYLGHAARASREQAPRPLHLFLDEAHAFAPRLVAEILGEGRKFGVRAVVSTQFPARLSTEVEHAVRGTTAVQVCFRVPAANAFPTMEWLGFDRRASPGLLTDLPTGTAVVVRDGFEPLAVPAPPVVPVGVAWQNAVQRTAPTENAETSAGDPTEDGLTEALLLAVLSDQEEPIPRSAERLVDAANRSPVAGGDRARLALRWSELVRRGWVLPEGSRWTLGSAGAAALGIGRRTGAPRESEEHRALLLEAFRLLARRGYRLDILRQGRFDTTLPDARLTLLPSPGPAWTPEEIGVQVDQAREGWAWRFFHGRDVHVEAEVSGALRAERIRHGCRKAIRAGAFALFVVSDPRRARRVREVLREMDLGVERAQVWTLRGALLARTPAQRNA